MGSVPPRREQLRDIEFGWSLLSQIVELEIGHAMAVRERDVIAVQATEDTACLIERAGVLCRAKGWILLTTSKAQIQDPSGYTTITTDTIDQLASVGARCAALGAGRVFLADKAAVLEAADRAGIVVFGVGSASLGD